MISKPSPPEQQDSDVPLRARHITLDLDAADSAKRRREARHQMLRVLPWLLLAGPVIAWQLLAVTQPSAHFLLDVLAAITMYLDIALHVDDRLLSAVNLQALPLIIGALVFALVSASLLKRRSE